jgi:DNA-binding transcriptional regulator YhcF (GntR family)
VTACRSLVTWRPFLEFRRGHGIKVTGTREKSDLLAQVHELVATARKSGYRKSELIAMIETVKG